MSYPTKKLGEVVDINPPKSEISNLAVDTAVSFVSMASINENVGTISNMQTKKLEDVKNGYTYFANNDVLFAKITPCMENGKVAIAQNLQSGIGFGTTEVHVLRPTNQVLPEWIYSNVSRDQFRTEAKKHMTGSAGQQRVPKEFLENVKISVPPVNSQKKIVERLDAIRKAQELCDQQIQKTEELFESILIEIEEIKGSKVKISDICFVKGGKRIPKGLTFSNKKTNHPYLRVVDFKDNSIDIDNLKYVDDLVFNEISNYKISKDDVYISIAGTTGLIGIIPNSLDGVNLTENAAKLVIKDKKVVSKEYLMYCLLIPSNQNSFRASTHNTSVGKLALFRIQNININLPTFQDQLKIVEKLEAVQNYKKLLLKQKAYLKELFDSVLDKSMKGEMDN